MLNFAKSARLKARREVYDVGPGYPLFNKDASFNKGAAVLEKLPNDERLRLACNYAAGRYEDVGEDPDPDRWVAIELKEIFGNKTESMGMKKVLFSWHVIIIRVRQFRGENRRRQVLSAHQPGKREDTG
jgi:hypothetical protein